MTNKNLQANYQLIPLSKITIKPQSRKKFDETELQLLADSIKGDGLLQPILVSQHGTEFRLVAGERRYRAMQILNETHIAAYVRDVQDIELAQFVENTLRVALTPIEKAIFIYHLSNERKLSIRDIAELMPSMSSSAVGRYKKLGEAHFTNVGQDAISQKSKKVSSPRAAIKRHDDVVKLQITISLDSTNRDESLKTLAYYMSQLLDHLNSDFDELLSHINAV